MALLSFRGSIFSQHNNTCPYKDWARDFVNLADSMSRFMDNTKAAVTVADWKQFTHALEKGEGEKAFDHLGKLSESAKTILNDLGYQLAAQKQKIYSILKTDDKTTDEGINEIISREIYCYFSDTVENSLPKLMEAAGKMAPPEVGMFGDCITEMRACMAAASAAHSSGLNSRISIASGGGGLFGWLGAIISGAGCFINVESNFNGAKLSCGRIFRACQGLN